MTDCSNILEKKLTLLRGEILGADGFNGEMCGAYAAFISVCDTLSRAVVLRGVGDNPEAAWDKACAAAVDHVRKSGCNAQWVKADITCSSRRVPFSELAETLEKTRCGSFRNGISFDEGMNISVIEAEISSARLIAYKTHALELTRVNRYLSSCGLPTLSGFPENVILFDCVSRFCDENGRVYALYGSGPDCGRRVIDGIDRDIALQVITTSSEYLSMQVGTDGKMDYGWYPLQHNAVEGYNIMRHCSAIWGMLCAYRLTGDKFTLGQAEKALAYLVGESFGKYPKRQGRDNTSYIRESTKGEVKLGAGALAILVMTEYMDITGSRQYTKLCRELGNGILELFDRRDGSFFHVLNYPQLSPKDKFRTVFYDGEATFALCRLYGLTGDQKWLEAAAMSADRFIREGYEKHRDHWVAYSMNELCKYLPEERYLSFGLKNAGANLKAIYNRDTTYHTYLELLCVTLELYTRIKDSGMSCSYLRSFSEDKFISTILRRAEFMLNGYGYPEYVMYFRYPSLSLGSFFMRHDCFRTRIDDVQHFCSAYYSFYKNYEKLGRG